MAAIERVTGYDTADEVRPTPCEGWTATDPTGHVLAAIENWHVLVDDSEARVPTARFGRADMDAYFSDRLAALGPGWGPETIGRFVERAEEYSERVTGPDLELPLVSALGR